MYAQLIASREQDGISHTFPPSLRVLLQDNNNNPLKGLEYRPLFTYSNNPFYPFGG